MPASIKHLRKLFKTPNAAMALFALWEGDDLYYKVDLVKLDEKNFKATVEFDDKSEHKVKTSQLHVQLSALDPDDDIVCCMCEGGDSVEPNELVLCDICQQGFHQECHQPNLSAEDIASDEWSCTTCERILNQSRPKFNTSSTPLPGIKKPKKLKVAVKPICPAKQLPVEILEADEAVHAVAQAIVMTDDLVESIAGKKVNKKKSARPA